MITVFRDLGLAAGIFALVTIGGCASTAEPGRGDVVRTTADTSIDGTWEGQVWENPSDYREGVQNITLEIFRNGSWTATTKGKECAHGEATVRAGLVFLRSRAADGPPCLPYSLQLGRGRMWGAFETAFKERAATAMVDLVHVRERPPESASAPSPR
jgi:hypothetical protein